MIFYYDLFHIAKFKIVFNYGHELNSKFLPVWGISRSQISTFPSSKRKRWITAISGISTGQISKFSSIRAKSKSGWTINFCQSRQLQRCYIWIFFQTQWRSEKRIRYRNPEIENLTGIFSSNFPTEVKESFTVVQCYYYFCLSWKTIDMTRSAKDFPAALFSSDFPWRCFFSLGWKPSDQLSGMFRV